MDLKESIEKIVQNLISEEYFIVDVSVSGVGGRPKVTVLIDGDGGITIDKCAEISRELGNEIEKRNIIDQNYILEVSSPGVDYPLKSLRQYNRNIGRKLKIQFEDNSSFTGVLKEVKEGFITIEAELPVKNREGKVLKNKKTFQEMEVPLEKIKKTNIIISFN